MHCSARVRVGLVLCIGLALVACGGGARRERAAAARGPAPEAVRQMQMPESPYYIIYSPPVSLAKQPDTTARARKPPS
jgi:hypothetical protein